MATIHPADSKRRARQDRPQKRVAGCQHKGMRAVTIEEEPRLDERRRQPFTCDDCTSVALGPTRFTMGFVINLLLADRARAID